MASIQHMGKLSEVITASLDRFSWNSVMIWSWRVWITWTNDLKCLAKSNPTVDFSEILHHLRYIKNLLKIMGYVPFTISTHADIFPINRMFGILSYKLFAPRWHFSHASPRRWLHSLVLQQGWCVIFIPSMKLTSHGFSPWKSMAGRWNFLLGWPIFQGRTVSFMECIIYDGCLIKYYSLLHLHMCDGLFPFQIVRWSDGCCFTSNLKEVTLA